MGVSEMQLFALDAVRQVKKLLNGLYLFVMAIAVEDITIKAFATRLRVSSSMCAGRLAGGLEVLAGHYSPPEPKEAERHTVRRTTRRTHLMKLILGLIIAAAIVVVIVPMLMP